MPNRRQKPPELLQGKGSRFRGTASLVPTADPERPIPLPPSGLRPVAMNAWSAFWRSPMASVVDENADMDALRDWAWLLSERDRLQASVKRKGVVPGSHGQPMLNPLARLVDAYTRRINSYREQFGMTPLSRMRLGIAIGDAHDALSDLFGELNDTAQPQAVDLDALAGEGDIFEVAP